MQNQTLYDFDAHTSPNKLKHGLKKIFHHRQYKHFTRFIKNHEINFLIQKLKTATKVTIPYYVQLVKKYINVHPGKGSHPIKANSELRRTQKLIYNLPNEIRQKLEQTGIKNKMKAILDSRNRYSPYLTWMYNRQRPRQFQTSSVSTQNLRLYTK